MTDHIDTSPEAVERLAQFAESANPPDASECAAHLRALSTERDYLTAENAAMVAILKEAERMCIEGYPVSAFNVARAALAASQPRKTDTNGG